MDETQETFLWFLSTTNKSVHAGEKNIKITAFLTVGAKHCR